MERNLNYFLKQENPSLEEVEREMIQLGYLVWPYERAFGELKMEVEERLADHFFEPLLNENLKNKYRDFKAYGAGWRDLRGASLWDVFDAEERGFLLPIVIEVEKKLKQCAEREAVGMGEKKYFQKVEKFTSELESIKDILFELEEMVENEEGVLVDEIRRQIYDFELSLCGLGGEINYKRTRDAKEFFVDRRDALRSLRGIEIPLQIDFYNNN